MNQRTEMKIAVAPEMLGALEAFELFLKVELEEMGNVQMTPRVAAAKLRAVDLLRSALEGAGVRP